MIATDSDLDFANNRFLLCSSTSGNSSAPSGGDGFFPINPFLAILAPPLASCVGVGGSSAVRGVPGDVGGRARGAELTECAPRLCACLEGAEEDSGERVFVKVIVTEKGSPAK